MLMDILHRLLLHTKGHLVCTSAYIVSTQGSILVAKHRLRKRPWGVPGGVVERREHPLAALRRELAEELDWTSRPHDWSLQSVDAAERFPMIEIAYLYRSLVAEDPSNFRIRSAEILATGWYDPHEMRKSGVQKAGGEEMILLQRQHRLAERMVQQARSS